MSKIIIVSFFLFLFSLFLLPPTDPDLGWQLRCGQGIWQGAGFCSKNTFSVLLPHYYWTNHHWFYQSIIFPVYKLFGLWGLTFLNAVVLTSAFGIFFFAIKGFLYEKILAILFTIYIGWGVFSFGLRSQELGILYFCVLVWLIPKVRKKFRLGFLLPLVMLLWVNSHGSFVLGIALIALLYPVFFLPSLLATLLNPFGLQIYLEVWKHFGGVDLSKLIAEWVSPSPAIYALVVISASWLFFYLILKKGLRGLLPAIGTLVFAFLALKAQRHLPYFFLFSFYALFTSFKDQSSLEVWLKQAKYSQILVAVVFCGVAVFGLFCSFTRTQKSDPLSYPYEAVDFLKNQKEGGVIFNRYEWGGFLIWQLPEYKFFVDGRMPAWITGLSSKSPYTIYLETLQTQPGWQETLQEYHIDWILISPGTFMDILLQPDPQKFGWQEVRRSATFVLYKRNSL